jgi:hypothetical protein
MFRSTTRRRLLSRDHQEEKTMDVMPVVRQAHISGDDEFDSSDTKPPSGGTEQYLPFELILWMHRRERRLSRTRRRKRLDIYERDGWICQLCFDPVDRRLDNPHPLSHSLDHKVPRADGGANTPDNLQLAHAICNHVRGDIALADIDPARFAAVRIEALVWLERKSRVRFKDQNAERKARRRWTNHIRRARSGSPDAGRAPQYAYA